MPCILRASCLVFPTSRICTYNTASNTRLVLVVMFPLLFVDPDEWLTAPRQHHVRDSTPPSGPCCQPTSTEPGAPDECHVVDSTPRGGPCRQPTSDETAAPNGCQAADSTPCGDPCRQSTRMGPSFGVQL